MQCTQPTSKTRNGIPFACHPFPPIACAFARVAKTASRYDIAKYIAPSRAHRHNMLSANRLHQTKLAIAIGARIRKMLQGQKPFVVRQCCGELEQPTSSLVCAPVSFVFVLPVSFAIAFPIFLGMHLTIPFLVFATCGLTLGCRILILMPSLCSNLVAMLLAIFEVGAFALGFAFNGVAGKESAITAITISPIAILGRAIKFIRRLCLAAFGAEFAAINYHANWHDTVLTGGVPSA